MYKKQHNTTIVLKASICTIKVHFLESTNVENANIFSKQGKVLRQTLFPPLMSQILTNRPLHTAFGIILQNLQNHHQSTGVAANDGAHPSDRISSCEPTSSCPTSPAGLCTVQARKGELSVEETTSAWDITVWAASQLPVAQARLGPWQGNMRKKPLFHSLTRSRQDSSLTKLMAQNLFPEHLKLSPKPSSISNAEPFGCHHTGQWEWLKKD